MIPVNFYLYKTKNILRFYATFIRDKNHHFNELKKNSLIKTYFNKKHISNTFETFTHTF